MPFIGNKPAQVPLTSADITDGIITSAKIADGTIVNADINASAAIVGTKLSGINDAKAWVNFNGSGTPAIRASFNVSSITDNGTGDFTINFTNALADANYAISSYGTQTSGASANYAYGLYSTGTTSITNITTSSFRFKTGWFGGTQLEDLPYIAVTICR